LRSLVAATPIHGTARRLAATGLVAASLVALLASTAAVAALGEEDARVSAGVFGKALTQADATLLSSILPKRGKVQLRLARLGEEQGFFSSDQVVALLGTFLRSGKAESFRVVRIELDEGRFALAQCRAQVTDAQGETARIDLRLAFQPESDRWVLREVRESAP
jgi:hypothetical protein